MFNRLGSTLGQATCYWLLFQDNRLDTAEAAALHEVGLLPKEGYEYPLCKSHHHLGNIYHHKGQREKAFDHFETALRIASYFNWRDELYWVHFALAALFSDEDEYGCADAHVEAAKLHAGNDAYKLGRAMGTQAVIRYRQSRLEDPRSEGSRALEVYRGLRAAQDVEGCRALLLQIDNVIATRFQANQIPGEFYNWGVVIHSY